MSPKLSFCAQALETLTSNEFILHAIDIVAILR